MRGTLSGNLEPETGRELKEPLFIQIKWVYHDQLIIPNIPSKSDRFVKLPTLNTKGQAFFHSNLTLLWQAQFRAILLTISSLFSVTVLSKVWSKRNGWSTIYCLQYANLTTY